MKGEEAKEDNLLTRVLQIYWGQLCLQDLILACTLAVKMLLYGRE